MQSCTSPTTNPLRCGLAGWHYPHWDRIVYPSPKPRNFHALEYLSQFFDVLEINTTFYQSLRPLPPDLDEAARHFRLSPCLRFWRLEAPFAAADVEAIASQIGGVRLVAPEVRSSATLVANGRNWSAQVTGSTQNWFSVANWTMASGRGFEPDEERVGAAVCVIGATVRRELFGGADPIGEQVRVKKFSCTVVGLLGSKGQGAMGNDQDNLLVLPLATMQRRVVGHTRINTILVSMNESADTERLKASLEQLMRERRKLAEADDNNFNVLDTRQIADTMSGWRRSA